MEVDGNKDRILRYADKNKKLTTMKKQLGELEDKWFDEESKRVLKGIISLDDFWRIPQYLMQELKNYKYYVRHHSLIFLKLYCMEYLVNCKLSSITEEIYG